MLLFKTIFFHFTCFQSLYTKPTPPSPPTIATSNLLSRPRVIADLFSIFKFSLLFLNFSKHVKIVICVYFYFFQINMEQIQVQMYISIAHWGPLSIT